MDFCKRLAAVIHNCKGVLSEKGKLAILMGNYSDHGTYMPLTYATAYLCMMEGLWPSCTEIIRFQHNNTSSFREYRSSFIPGLHDTCLIVEKKA